MISILNGTPVPDDLPAWEETFTTSPVPGERYMAFGLKLSTQTILQPMFFDYCE